MGDGRSAGGGASREASPGCFRRVASRDDPPCRQRRARGGTSQEAQPGRRRRTRGGASRDGCARPPSNPPTGMICEEGSRWRFGLRQAVALLFVLGGRRRGEELGFPRRPSPPLPASLPIVATASPGFFQIGRVLQKKLTVLRCFSPRSALARFAPPGSWCRGHR